MFVHQRLTVQREGRGIIPVTSWGASGTETWPENPPDAIIW